MSKTKIEIHMCDLCEFESREGFTHSQYNTLSFSRYWCDGPGPHYSFLDLCVECNKKIGEVVNQIEKTIEELKREC